MVTCEGGVRGGVGVGGWVSYVATGVVASPENNSIRIFSWGKVRGGLYCGVRGEAPTDGVAIVCQGSSPVI